MLRIVLPSGNMNQSVASLDPKDGVSVPVNCTYCIQEPAEALSHATNLLCMLVDISVEAAKSYDATPAFQDYLAWILDSFLVTHESQRRWPAKPSLYHLCSENDKLSFCAVHALLTSLGGSLSPMLKSKGYTLLAALCSSLFEHRADISSDSFRLCLCHGLLSLAAFGKQYDCVRRAVSLHLLPVLQVSLNNADQGMSPSNDVKV